MNENLNMTNETQGSAAGGRRANPSDYLDRKSSTILMVIKLAEGLSKLCLVILAAFVLQTLVSALNRIFQQEQIAAEEQLKGVFIRESLFRGRDSVNWEFSFDGRPF